MIFYTGADAGGGCTGTREDKMRRNSISTAQGGMAVVDDAVCLGMLRRHLIDRQATKCCVCEEVHLKQLEGSVTRKWMRDVIHMARCLHTAVSISAKRFEHEQ